MSLIDIQRGAQKIIEQAIRDESRAQGHYLTGAMEESLSGFIENNGTEKTLTGTAVGYTVFVNGGVSSDRVPFAPGSGAKTSKYIEGLKSFWRLRGLDEEEATRAAFATARKHKAEGMPTQGSYSHSSTGARLEMIETAFEKKGQVLDQYMSNGLDGLVETEFQKTKRETI